MAGDVFVLFSSEISTRELMGSVQSSTAEAAGALLQGHKAPVAMAACPQAQISFLCRQIPSEHGIWGSKFFNSGWVTRRGSIDLLAQEPWYSSLTWWWCSSR